MDNKIKLFLQHGTDDVTLCLQEGYNLHPITGYYHRPIKESNIKKYIDPVYVIENGKEKQIIDIECDENDKKTKPPKLTKLERKYKYIAEYGNPLVGHKNKGFLFILYNILSFEQSLAWITENENENIITKLRIIDASWFEYGHTLETPNHILVNFYISVIKTLWLKQIYYELAKYIYADDNSIYLKENKLPTGYKKIERINFMVKKYASNQVVYDMLLEFIKNKETLWEDVIDFSYRIKHYYLSTVTNIIKKTLNK